MWVGGGVDAPVEVEQVRPLQRERVTRMPQQQRLPGGASARQFIIVNFKMQAAIFNIQFDLITVAYQSERSTGC